MNQKISKKNNRVQGVKWVLLVCAVMGISACVSGGGTIAVAEDTIRKQESIPMRPHAANVIFSWLQLPSEVDVNSFTAFKLSLDGKIMIGSSAKVTPLDESLRRKPLQAFRWDWRMDEWLWLDNLKYENGSALMGMDSSGDYVFGAQWVWQKEASQMTMLAPDFWAYVLRDDGYFLGAGLDSSITMMRIDGSQKKSWPVADVLKLDDRGNLKDTLLFSESGILISSTMEECLLDDKCHQAYFTRWTPEQGSVTLAAQMPERPETFIQSNAGPQQISQNGEWLAGSVGQGLYLWDAQGQIKFLGGFDNGATVVALSNDGKVVVGYTVGNKTKLARSWIWTETEGLGWLDEWLRNHGVTAESVSQNMQVKLLSPDRRVMIGVTPPESESDPQAQPRWWKVNLSEYLRVLVH